ncbi:hypothetical protein XcfCFBP6994P_23190 [Xanthomonas citri pv. phaseoli var. fuscans]|nr:hypothetical protein [Xanthomonas citri]QTF76556.1 hypothetical protein XcfCFBP6994P_23190 [Xanthomonas citri pv. phaseoli var. fuscans]
MLADVIVSTGAASTVTPASTGACASTMCATSRLTELKSNMLVLVRRVPSAALMASTVARACNESRPYSAKDAWGWISDSSISSNPESFSSTTWRTCSRNHGVPVVAAGASTIRGCAGLAVAERGTPSATSVTPCNAPARCVFRYATRAASLPSRRSNASNPSAGSIEPIPASASQCWKLASSRAMPVFPQYPQSMTFTAQPIRSRN